MELIARFVDVTFARMRLKEMDRVCAECIERFGHVSPGMADRVRAVLDDVERVASGGGN